MYETRLNNNRQLNVSNPLADNFSLSQESTAREIKGWVGRASGVPGSSHIAAIIDSRGVSVCS